MGFRGLLLEPDEARAAGAAALGFPLLTAVPDDLDDSADLVVTDHHRPELGVMLRDALATKARWVGIMGNPHHVGPHVAMLTELGVPADEIARVHRPIGLNIGSRIPPRSPSPRWPACSPTATAAPADSNSDPANPGLAGIITRRPGMASRRRPAGGRRKCHPTHGSGASRCGGSGGPCEAVPTGCRWRRWRR